MTGLKPIFQRLTLAILLVASLPALAAGTAKLTYGGRLTSGNGTPVVGPVELEIGFYAAPTDGTPIGRVLTPHAVPLVDGVFAVELDLDDGELHTVFADPDDPIWIQVKDTTHGVVHPRQRFHFVPYALKVPVDGKTLNYTGTGKLQLRTPDDGNSGDILVTDGSGNLSWQSSSFSVGIDDSIGDGQTTRVPSQNAVFDALALKENSLAAGTTAQYFRGDKSWQPLATTNVAEGTNLYFTAPRAQSAAVADALTDGVTTVAPSQNAVFDALTGKESLLAAGSTAQYLRGDKSWQTLNTTNVTEGANQYFTVARAKGAAVADVVTDAVTDVAPSQNAVYDQLALKQALSQKNAANGYAGLDASGKILASNMPYSGLAYQGTWNAGTNAPPLTSGACGTQGNYYVVSAGGATTLDTISSWSLGDWVICGGGSAWQRVGNSSGGVTTVNGLTGSTITLDTDDVNEGSTNLYFSNARAKAAAVADNLANGTTDVAPSQNAVYDAVALKEDAFAAGSAAQYFRGDKTWQTLDTANVPESGNLYFTTARAKSAAVTDAIADAVTDVAPSQNAVYDALATTNANVAAKEPTIAAGTTAQYWRGDKSWQTLSTTGVAEGTNLYFTTTRAKSAAVADALADTVTDVAPSQNAVFDALAAKASTTHAHSSLDASDGTPAQALSVDAAGKVGIGTTVPLTLLQIEGTNPIMTFKDSSSASEVNAMGGFEFFTSNGTRIGWMGDGSPTGNLIGMAADTGEVRLTTAAAQPIRFMTAGLNERMRIDGTGKVGIGSATPAAKLDVAGDIRLGNSAATCDATTEGSIRYNSTGKALEVCNGSSWVSAVPRHDYILIQDQQSAATNGQLATAGTWTTMNLNQEVADTGNNASLASNQVTLQPGKYHCNAHSPAYKTQRHLIRLWNVTAGAVHAYGSAHHSEDSDYTDNVSMLETYLNLGVATTFRIDHYAELGWATYGAVFGVAPAVGIAVYTTIECVRFQ